MTNRNKPLYTAIAKIRTRREAKALRLDERAEAEGGLFARIMREETKGERKMHRAETALRSKINRGRYA